MNTTDCASSDSKTRDGHRRPRHDCALFFSSTSFTDEQATQGNSPYVFFSCMALVGASLLPDSSSRACRIRAVPSILPSASFDALGIIWCPFLAPFFSCFLASHAPFDNRNGLRDVLLLLGEPGAIVLRIQMGGAPDARKRGVEPSLSGPVRGCIIWCTTGHYLMPLCGRIDTKLVTLVTLQ